MSRAPSIPAPESPLSSLPPWVPGPGGGAGDPSAAPRTAEPVRVVEPARPAAAAGARRDDAAQRSAGPATARPAPEMASASLRSNGKPRPGNGGPEAPWRTVRTLRPGDAGTVKLQRSFGDRLVCVRYRRDPAGRRLVTVELVVADNTPPAVRPATSRPAPPPSSAGKRAEDFQEGHARGSKPATRACSAESTSAVSGTARGVRDLVTRTTDESLLGAAATDAIPGFPSDGVEPDSDGFFEPLLVLAGEDLSYHQRLELSQLTTKGVFYNPKTRRWRVPLAIARRMRIRNLAIGWAKSGTISYAPGPEGLGAGSFSVGPSPDSSSRGPAPPKVNSYTERREAYLATDSEAAQTRSGSGPAKYPVVSAIPPWKRP